MKMMKMLWIQSISNQNLREIQQMKVTDTKKSPEGQSFPSLRESQMIATKIHKMFWIQSVSIED
jgi:hypothetical protein